MPAPRLPFITADDPESVTGANDAIEIACRLAEVMRQRWRSGERPRAEEMLACHPWLLDDAEATLELVAEELHLRYESGEPPDEEQFEQRFPRWRPQIRALLDCHRVLAPRLAPPRFPGAGESLGDFQLLAELGRGLHGVVFLASQPKLSDRAVVLKISQGEGEEHLSLARLQHTHIVPLYSVHEFPERGLRVLCLPYFGGATLADLLHVLRDIPPEQRSGCDLRAALCRAAADAPVSVTADGPVASFFARASYVQAVCWLGLRLADALAYAAERGLVHLDIKPSNVLLAADGQPMLLDFHLARAPLPAGKPAPAWLGGTPDYMAPEQRAALSVVHEGGRVEFAVDGRADVYSLGLVLYEMLGGAVPLLDDDVARALRRRNRQVSAGLAALLGKCVAADANHRYGTAAELADDLRRHLENLPLRGVANRSISERCMKWRRRHRLAIPVMGLLAALIAMGSFFFERTRRQVERAREALQSGDELLQRRQYTEAAEALRYARTLTEGVPFCRNFADRLRQRSKLAEHGLAAGELHQWCERIRPLYGAEPLQDHQARAVLVHCRTLWARRQLIAGCLAGEAAPDMQQQVRADLLDLAILLADLCMRLAAPGELETARQESLRALDEAERLFGMSCVLNKERQALDPAALPEAVDPSAKCDNIPRPRSAWEHLALGRIYFRSGRIAAAEKEMDESLELEPGALWPNFWKGNCAFRLARFDDAVASFSVCVALAPRAAWCFANRGLAHSELGKLERAAEDFDHALRLDPTLAAAFRGRGLLHFRARRYAEALSDLRQTLELGVEPAGVYADLALVQLAAGNPAEAIACARLSLKLNPAEGRARELLRRIDQRK